jgi:cysteinyl-tRNA synthetase
VLSKEWQQIGLPGLMNYTPRFLKVFPLIRTLKSTTTEHTSSNAASSDSIQDLIDQGQGIINSYCENSPDEKKQHNTNQYNYRKGTEEFVSIVNGYIEQRMKARFVRDFVEADRIKDMLFESFQVEIFDALGIWRSASGLSGCIRKCQSNGGDKILPVRPVKSNSDDVPFIQDLVNKRTLLRRKHNYKEADEIRIELANMGIELLEVSNQWRSYDGSLSGVQSSDRKS